MTDFPANDGDEDTVDSKPAMRARDDVDTFRPARVDDRFRRRVRDDHAPNAALHASLRAAAEPDGPIASVNLMGSHAPGEKPHEPTYHVRVTIENDAMGEPSTGPTILQELIERDDVTVTKAYGGARYDDVDVKAGVSAEEAASKTIHDAVDYITVHIRPVEKRVEPIEVRVRDIPDRVFEERVDRVPLCSTYECTNDADRDRRYQFDSGFTIELPLCGECDEHIDANVFDDVDLIDEPESMADATKSGLGLAFTAEAIDRRSGGEGVAREDVDISDEAIDKAIDRGVVIERGGLLFDTRDVVRRVQAIERGSGE